jgi:hypothetical protein
MMESTKEEMYPVRETRQANQDSVELRLSYSERIGSHKAKFSGETVHGVIDQAGTFHPLQNRSQEWSDLISGVQVRHEGTQTILRIDRDVCPVVVCVEHRESYWGEDASWKDNINYDRRKHYGICVVA